MKPDSGEGRTLARVDGRSGEVVIRASGDELELIVNGVYLMDTRSSGKSERLLARAAVELCPRTAPRCLVGGLGFGYTLDELLTARPDASVTCVELEPTVVGRSTPRPGVDVVIADVVEWLASTEEKFDIVLLDVDNGPSWMVREQNGRLYDDAGLALLSRRLRPGGVVGIWSAQPEPDFARRLARVFAGTHAIEVPVARGVPDVVYLAAGPVPPVPSVRSAPSWA